MRTKSGLYRRQLRGTRQFDDDHISAYPCAVTVDEARPVPLHVGQPLQAGSAEGVTFELSAKVVSGRTRLLVYRRPARASGRRFSVDCLKIGGRSTSDPHPKTRLSATQNILQDRFRTLQGLGIRRQDDYLSPGRTKR